ncbi:hypothetical protein ASE66_01035 [Bosea sp. Root483D1]|nr:hypothetical protein ASE66_01035 [Bosea sp. Root483D1]
MFKLGVRKQLVDNGWSVSERPRSDDLGIVGRLATLDVDLSESLLSGEPAPDLAKVYGISVHLTLTDRQLALGINSAHIPITISDLAHFKEADGSVWSIIRHLARRMVKSSDLKARERFFGVLLGNATAQKSDRMTLLQPKFMEGGVVISVRHVEEHEAFSMYEYVQVPIGKHLIYEIGIMLSDGPAQLVELKRHKYGSGSAPIEGAIEQRIPASVTAKK